MGTERADTVTRILDAAIRLFNAEGTAAVSTNHISRAAGISPGNLYYHFRNKEEIIRAILERMYQAFNKVWTLPAGRPLTVSDFELAIKTTLALEWEYRFFYRELVALIRHDPQLGRRHRAIQQQRIREVEQWGDRFVAAGVLRLPPDEADADALLTAAWLISNYWVSFLEAGGLTVRPQQMEAGVDVIMRLLRPYLIDPPTRRNAKEGITDGHATTRHRR